jgi:hypothetical protein
LPLKNIQAIFRYATLSISNYFTFATHLDKNAKDAGVAQW